MQADMSLKREVEKLAALNLGKHRYASVCNLLADTARRKIYDELGIEMRPSIWYRPLKSRKKPAPYVPDRDTEEREEADL